MAWGKLEDTYHDDPKFRRLSELLGFPKLLGEERGMVLAQGHVSRLWSWAHRHAPDGYLVETQASTRDLERVMGWPSAGGRLVQGLLTAGFLDEAKDGSRTVLIIHRFWERAESHKAAIKKKKQRDDQKNVPGQSRPELNQRPDRVPVRGEDREERRGEERTERTEAAPPETLARSEGDPNSLTTYQLETIPIVDARAVWDAWAEQLREYRKLQIPLMPSPRDLHAFKLVLLWSGRDVAAASKIARAWVYVDDVKGTYLRDHGWAPWLLAEEKNYTRARAVLGKMLTEKSKQRQNQQP